MDRNLLLGGIAATGFLGSALIWLGSWVVGNMAPAAAATTGSVTLAAAATAEQKAAAIVEIARSRHYDALPQLLTAIEDGNPAVAGRAVAAVQHLLGVRYEVKPGYLNSPKERRQLATLAREDWAKLQKFPRFQQSQEALR